jgi:ribosome-associated toxin RatA of RatAB toxin-antitoxin module
MVHVQLLARISGRDAKEVFPLLSDLKTYPSCVEAVHSITVEEQDGRFVSTWEVDFHGGIMRWKEEDVFLPEENTFQFRQIEGDLDAFSGEWRITDEDGGCRVDFWADFDLGIPGLSETLEPIAEAALRENIRGIISGILGAVQFE